MRDFGRVEVEKGRSEGVRSGSSEGVGTLSRVERVDCGELMAV